MEIFEEDADRLRLDELSRRLLKDLRRGGLDVERSAAEAPAGAKSGAAVAISSLLVAFSGAAGGKALVQGIFSWLGPRRGSVKISCGDRVIELSAATPERQQQLFEWLQSCGEEVENSNPEDRED
ncbi:hypothetical protein LUW76_22610 [Actinomadura madurae]|uniref:effector-associated constant component EACC1 n=1 Tax=Actinomadura madurae TaxID=1993 RepID=UPI002026A9A9|nr:hypothetical protein [Actinomadura madurae]MCP9968171.1 hypothetical protein [Actinomadura madurae]MCQ0016831.1 hypothetical protein [Actinomadura madurae]URM96915.1 hypothetical protein LUW76_22610 [Actinomadura madurae]